MSLKIIFHRRLARIWRRVGNKIYRWVRRTNNLHKVYYLLFDRSFDREQRAVIAGRLSFEKSRKGSGNTTSLLRRNIHRLEKGILMRPRRSIFALDYIEETLQNYEVLSERQRSGSFGGNLEISWAHDVLKAYFEITGSDPKIDKLRVQFKALPPVGDTDECNKLSNPYVVGASANLGIGYHEYLALAQNRKSVRWFLEKKVPRELIEKIVDAARYSPSACNRQPFFFRVFDDPDLVGRVAGLPGGTKGFAENIPVIITVIGEQRNYYGERDRHLIYIDASLAVMSLVLAAETLGLATCCINWPDIEEYEQQAEKVLKLESDQRPVMFVALGYPDPTGMVAYSEKKPVEDLCRFNFE